MSPILLGVVGWLVGSLVGWFVCLSVGVAVLARAGGEATVVAGCDPAGSDRRQRPAEAGGEATVVVGCDPARSGHRQHPVEAGSEPKIAARAVAEMASNIVFLVFMVRPLAAVEP